MIVENKLSDIVQPLLVWYGENARSLPWRKPAGEDGQPDPYHVWLSEIMLQQTRVEAVKGYYERFLRAFPTVQDLAEASTDHLMKLWQGLGYYNRARNLQRSAQMIVGELDGKFPATYEEILKLSGIGEYTAGAIASIAFGEQIPAVDGNVYRIYTRLQRDGSDITSMATKRRIRQEVAAILPENAGTFNQALMDLGAMVCIPNGEPACAKCPLAEFCMAYHEGDMLSYPYKPPKNPRRIEERTVFIVEYQGKYLLQKRSEKGLLAGLWEFPACEGFLDVSQAAQRLRETGVYSEGEISLLGRGKHIFSHVEWHMLGYLVRADRLREELDEDGVVWAGPEEIREKYSIPSAFSCYLSQLHL